MKAYLVYNQNDVIAVCSSKGCAIDMAKQKIGANRLCRFTCTREDDGLTMVCYQMQVRRFKRLECSYDIVEHEMDSLICYN